VSGQLLELLACPACRRELGDDGLQLRCAHCGSRYPVVDGVPHILPPTEGSRWREWEVKQELGLAEYEAEEEPSQHVLGLARAFAEFADPVGLVLDVGCGTAARPPYHRRDGRARYVGVDPLAGTSARDFEFVVGVGEHLPFRSACFDVVLSATTLDHVVDPGASLREARRVLRSEGRVALWMGVVDSTALRRVVIPEYPVPTATGLRRRLAARDVHGIGSAALRHLVVNPARRATTELRFRRHERETIDTVYADRASYHFRFFKESDVLRLLDESGLDVLDTRSLGDEAHGRSFFALAQPRQRGPLARLRRLRSGRRRRLVRLRSR
jgi:SAM-dependent methyltransferase